MWHPEIQDIINAHETAAEVSKVRTEGFRQSEERGISSIVNVLREARDQEDIYGAAAIYLKQIIDEHPFNDGNKRTAVLVTVRFLNENNHEFAPRKVQNTEELYDFIKWELPSMTLEETANWIKNGELKDEV